MSKYTYEKETWLDDNVHIKWWVWVYIIVTYKIMNVSVQSTNWGWWIQAGGGTKGLRGQILGALCHI